MNDEHGKTAGFRGFIHRSSFIVQHFCLGLGVMKRRSRHLQPQAPSLKPQPRSRSIGPLALLVIVLPLVVIVVVAVVATVLGRKKNE